MLYSDVYAVYINFLCIQYLHSFVYHVYTYYVYMFHLALCVAILTSKL